MSTQPKELFAELTNRLVIIEAAAENEKEVMYGYWALFSLSAKILSLVICSEWNKDEWSDAIFNRNMPAIQEHCNRISDSKRYDLLHQSVVNYLWQNTYFDAMQGAGEYIDNYFSYLRLLLNHCNLTLQCLFNHLSTQGGQLPEATIQIILPLVEDTIESIIQDATR